MTGSRYRINLLGLCLLVALPATQLRAAQAGSPPAVTASGPHAPAPAASTTAKPVTTNLGKVQVTGIKQLVHTLQVVKVALNQPFSANPDKADVVVCRISHDHGDVRMEARMGAILECGTNSWFTSRRDAYRQSGNTASAVVDAHNTPVYERKGAWHSMRALSLQQVQALRKLLNKLPTPDSNKKIRVEMDDSAKP